MVRLLHWGLAGSVMIAFVAEGGERLHEWLGYLALGLVALRILWGLVGPRPARFSSFVRPPAEVAAYLAAMAARRAPRHLGHNPAGGAMIVALLAGVVLVVGSGWLMVTDRFWGVAWVEEVHEVSGNLLIALAAVHVAGVIVSSLEHGENLVLAMITGRKRAAGPGEVP
jgi:cytochrome b